MKIDIKNRLTNSQFWIRLIITAGFPIFILMGLQPESLNTWDALGNAIIEFISNPYWVIYFFVLLYQSFMKSVNEVEDNEPSV